MKKLTVEECQARLARLITEKGDYNQICILRRRLRRENALPPSLEKAQPFSQRAVRPASNNPIRVNEIGLQVRIIVDAWFNHNPDKEEFRVTSLALWRLLPPACLKPGDYDYFVECLENLKMDGNQFIFLR